MKKNHTRRALFSVLIPVACAIITIVLFLIASILEEPTNGGAVYLFIMLAALAGLFCIPAVAMVCDIIGGLHSLLALKGGESRWKNVLILIFAVLSIAAAVALGVENWRRLMS